MSIKRLISRTANSCGECNKCVERPTLQGDCVGLLEDDRRPIEMQMVAVDVISVPVTCTCRRVSLFQIRSPFSLDVATRKQAASLQKSYYQAATNPVTVQRRHHSWIKFQLRQSTYMYRYFMSATICNTKINDEND